MTSSAEAQRQRERADVTHRCKKKKKKFSLLYRLPLVILNETKKNNDKKKTVVAFALSPRAFPFRSHRLPFHEDQRCVLSTRPCSPLLPIIRSSVPLILPTSLQPLAAAGRRLSDLFIKAGRRDQLRSCRTSLSSEWAGFESGPAKKKEFVADHTKFLVFNLTSSYKLELNYLGKDGPIVCFSHVTISKI